MIPSDFFVEGGMTVDGDKNLKEWVKIFLYVLNGVTLLITICNIIYLRRSFPMVNEFFAKRAMNLKQTSMHINNSGRNRNGLQNDPAFKKRRDYRYRIQTYFYVVSVIPLCVSAFGHYGARFPEEALWIFPGMNIAIGIGFLAFMQMMIMSCEGWGEIKKALIKKPDECTSWKNRPLYKKCCKKCCCNVFFLKENAYEGIKQRILWCCLIIVKPIVNYTAAVFEFDYHTDNKDQKIVNYAMKTLTMFTTFIPLNVMKSFHGTLLPYTRLRRSAIKCSMIGFLAPICQLQELVVNFVFGHWDLPGFDGIEDKYKWCCAYGMILVVEMVFISALITFVAYRPRDLRLWEFSESFLVEHGYDPKDPKMKDEHLLFGAAGTLDNMDEPVPDQAYISTNSVDYSFSSRLTVNSLNSLRLNESQEAPLMSSMQPIIKND